MVQYGVVWCRHDVSGGRLAGQEESRMQDTAGFRRSYLISAVIVWVSIIVASALILRGTSYFSQMLPVIGGGAVWFVVIVPGILYRRR